MLKYTPRPNGLRFVLVFDGIDRQRDAPHTLLPALARLSEIVGNPIAIHMTPADHSQIPSITTVFIVTAQHV